MAILDSYSPRDASRGYVWIQIRTNLLDEPEFMRLSDTSKAVYFEVYALAGRSDAGGLVLASDKPATVDGMAWLLRRDTNELQSALDELAQSNLVDLQGGHVTVCRFASEQGPSMAKQREQWALRQAKRRARAKGESWTEPETDAEPDTDKNKKTDAVKDLNQKPEQDNNKTQTKTKRVTELSRDNHAIVTRDNVSELYLNEYANDVLTVWQDKTGKKQPKSRQFMDLCQDWINARVSIQDVTQATVYTLGVADTPFYLRDVAINLANKRPGVQSDKRADAFRKLWQEQKAKQDGYAESDEPDTDTQDSD